MRQEDARGFGHPNQYRSQYYGRRPPSDGRRRENETRRASHPQNQDPPVPHPRQHRAYPHYGHPPRARHTGHPPRPQQSWNRQQQPPAQGIIAPAGPQRHSPPNIAPAQNEPAFRPEQLSRNQDEATTAVLSPRPAGLVAPGHNNAPQDPVVPRYVNNHEVIVLEDDEPVEAVANPRPNEPPALPGNNRRASPQGSVPPANHVPPNEVIVVEDDYDSSSGDDGEVDPFLPFQGEGKFYFEDPDVLMTQLKTTYRTEDTALSEMPEVGYEFPQNYKKRVRSAYKEVVARLEKRERELQQQQAAQPQNHSDDSSGDDSDESDDDDSSGRFRIVRKVGGFQSKLSEYRSFLKDIAESPAFNFGFQVPSILTRATEWCCCPVPDCKTFQRRVPPRSLVSHLTSVVGPKVGIVKTLPPDQCVEKLIKDLSRLDVENRRHGLVLLYLESLYRRHHYTGDEWLPHLALCGDAKTYPVGKVEQYESSKLVREFEVGKEEHAKLEQQRDSLLASVNSLEEEVKEIHRRNARAEIQKMSLALEKAFSPIKEKEIELFKEAYQRRCKEFQARVQHLSGESSQKAKLILPISVAEEFEKWKEECPRSSTNHLILECIHCQMNRMLFNSELRMKEVKERCEKLVFTDEDLTSTVANYTRDLKKKVQRLFRIGFIVEDGGVLLDKKKGAAEFVRAVWNEWENLGFRYNSDWQCYEAVEDESKLDLIRAGGSVIAFALFHQLEVPRNLLHPYIWACWFRDPTLEGKERVFTSFDDATFLSSRDKKSFEGSQVREVLKGFGIVRISENESSDQIYQQLLANKVEIIKKQIDEELEQASSLRYEYLIHGLSDLFIDPSVWVENEHDRIVAEKGQTRDTHDHKVYKMFESMSIPFKHFQSNPFCAYESILTTLPSEEEMDEIDI